jgi:hypothetical protein
VSPVAQMWVECAVPWVGSPASAACRPRSSTLRRWPANGARLRRSLAQGEGNPGGVLALVFAGSAAAARFSISVAQRP